MGTQDGSTILRTSLAVGLVGLGLVAAVMEVRADLTPFETRRAAYRLQFDTRWRAHVGTIEQALARHDVSAAVRAWHDAYGAALASRGWEGMIAVGDAFLRIGTEAGTLSGARSNARQGPISTRSSGRIVMAPWTACDGRPRGSRPWETTRWQPTASASRTSWRPTGKEPRP